MAYADDGLSLKIKDEENSLEDIGAMVALRRIRWRVVVAEVKKVGCVAGPMVAVSLAQYMLLVISMMMVGHVSELALSSTAMAISLSGVTGFSIIQGMASALETLGGQAYGAQQYRKVRIQIYTAIFSLLLVCIPLSVLWIYMEKVLLLLGQDPEIAHEAGLFLRALVPALYAQAFFQPLVRYFQSQSLTTAMLISSCVIFCFHIPLCWFLVFTLGLANYGAALSIIISYWLNVIFLVLYMRFSPACAKTSAPISMELFQGIGEFFRFGIPSAVMICLEWWSFELLIVLSGLLPNPQLETSVLSVCLNTIATLYSIPYGIGAGGSTRISNELGAGNPQAARVVVIAVMLIAVAEAVIVSLILFATRNVFGYLFSNESEVVDYVRIMAPLICLSASMDSIQGVLSGIARGCGWQHLGAYINLGAFYLFGIPVACLLGFWMNLNGKGLWIGIVFGSLVQSVLLAVVSCGVNYEKEARKARDRMFDERSSLTDNLLA